MMNIYARCGHKVKFTNEGGYELERENALKIVADTEVHSFSSGVYLEEFPGKYFNTCLFEDVFPDVATDDELSMLMNSDLNNLSKEDLVKNIKKVLARLDYDNQ